VLEIDRDDGGFLNFFAHDARTLSGWVWKGVRFKSRRNACQ
jgi:hypothetical protein